MRELLWVYLGRSSGLIVNLVFLPLYSRWLGAEAFGIVAVVLSVSSMLTVLDLGTTQRVTNGLANTGHPGSQRLFLLASLDLCLRLVAAGLASLALAVVVALGGVDIGITVALAAGLLWAQWRLNLHLTALQASHEVRAAAVVGLGGLGLRGGASAMLLWQFGAGIDAFLLTQATITFALVAACRARLRWLLAGADASRRAGWRDALAHLRGSKALIWTGLVGALSTQADKVLISTLMSPTDLAPYFLAATLAGAPLSVLGAPLAQVLQIRFARHLVARDTAGYRATWRFGLGGAGLAVVLPCGLIALAADPICLHWLGDAELAERVAHYTRLLLIGYAMAALGYIPYAAVMARADFGFQARLATVAMVLQLAGFTVAASLHQVEGLCWTWAAYFGFCSLGLALRSRHLDRQRPDRLQPQP